MNYITYAELSKIIYQKIYKLNACNFDLVVGVPRSGMIPAYMIALYLNIHCCDIEALVKNHPLKTGSTRKAKNTIRYPHEAKRILLVDDSIMSGSSLANELRRIPSEIADKITTLAIFSSEKVRDDVDIYLLYLPAPRVFEWNIFHHPILRRSGFDIDGVLCEDPTEVQNDDGEKYKDFILNAEPLFIPTVKINTLVTSRLEKYRSETEEWLHNNGVKYERMVMLDLPSKEERQRMGIHAKHKAEKYKQLDLDLFFESDYKQALEIHNLTKKPVFCVETNIMLTKGTFSQVIYGSRNRQKMLVSRLLKKIPLPIYNTMRLIHKKVESTLKN